GLPVWNAVSEFLAAGTGAGGPGGEGERIAEREFDVGGRQIRVQIASLGSSPDGCVVALDDATAFTRAARVLAWGEMARQVAHEIKNPLTPIRLGVQHLRRAHSDPRIDYDRVLNDNVRRILAEIDRLDEIARSFSRYGSAPADLPPAVDVDVAAVAKDVVGLEQMGDRKMKWQLRGADRPVWAMARKDELRDVLLNVFENARLAGARRVDIALREEERRVMIETVDDGSGIPSA